ncbi:MAG: CHAT domain-containing protein [Symploca sp. SIO2D2]|nr:CHAT domain-containing protein [Symploca sp. SIO2D2]
MDNKLDQRSYHVLFSFCSALVSFSIGISAEQLDELLFLNQIDEIKKGFRDILQGRNTHLNLSPEEIEAIKNVLERARNGHPSDVLQLRNLAYQNPKLKEAYVKAGAYSQRQQQSTKTRYEEEVSQYHNREELLVEIIDSVLKGDALDLSDNPRTSGDEELESTQPTKAITSCYVHAEINDYVAVNRATTLDVTISGESIDFQYSPSSQGGVIKADTGKKLIVQVLAKKNFYLLDEDRIEIAPPLEGEHCTLHFDLKPTHLGEGEIWVVLRQGLIPLLTLSVRTKILETPRQVREASAAATSTRSLIDGVIHDIPSLNPPLHQLRIIEQEYNNKIRYHYELESIKLGLLHKFDSKEMDIDRREYYVKSLYKKIETRWRSARKDRSEFLEELRAFGGELLDELIPPELKRILWERRSALKNIMVLSTEPFIPWELVHLKEPDCTYLPEEVAFLGQMGLVRWTYDVGYPPDTIKIRRDRSYYVIPNYPKPELRLPQAAKESFFLEQVFQAQSIEAKLSKVRKHLESRSIDLLHFAGHGQADQGDITKSQLELQGYMEGNEHVPDYLSSTVVRQHAKLNSVDKNKPLIVLNACQIGREGYTLTGIGGFAEAFLQSGAGAFVGPLWSVLDSPARMFTETLYLGLKEGLTLSEASIKAREKASELGDATWLAYAVYGHPDLKIDLPSTSE